MGVGLSTNGASAGAENPNKECSIYRTKIISYIKLNVINSFTLKAYKGLTFIVSMRIISPHFKLNY